MAKADIETGIFDAIQRFIQKLEDYYRAWDSDTDVGVELLIDVEAFMDEQKDWKVL